MHAPNPEHLAAVAAASASTWLKASEHAIGEPDDLDAAIRILALVARGVSLGIAVAEYVSADEYVGGRIAAEYPELAFFTDCMVCGGQLVTAGSDGNAPTHCAACPDPSDPLSADSRQRADLGAMARAQLATPVARPSS